MLPTKPRCFAPSRLLLIPAFERLLRFVLLLTMAGHGCAATKYLNKSAVGANDGSSPANAWQSVSAINLGNLASGDVLIISGGDYSSEELALYFPGRTNITFAFDPASLQPAIFRACQFFRANNCTLDGLKEGVAMIRFVGLASVNGNLESSIVVRESDGPTVRGCEITHAGLSPNDGRSHHGVFFLGTVSRGLVEKCTLADIITDGININNSSAPPPPGTYEWFRIAENRILRTGDDGIQSAFGGITVARNFIDQGGAPLFPGAHPDGFQLNPGRSHVRLIGNTIRGYNQNIFIEYADGAGNIEVYNNIVTGVWPDPTGLRTSRALNYSARDSFSGAFVFANNVCHNLLSFYALNGGLGNATQAATRFENNVFVNCRLIASSPTEAARLGPSNIYFNLAGVQYFNAAGVPVATATDQMAGGARYVDPEMISATSGDFRAATSTAPMVDTGVDLSAFFADDHMGSSRPSGSAWDIGAFEYIETEPPGNIQPPSNAIIQILTSEN